MEPITDELRSDLWTLIACAENSQWTSTNEAAERVREWIDSTYSDDDVTVLDLDLDSITTNLTDLNGKVLTAAEVLDFHKQGYRTYDKDCQLSMSHTKHFCGYLNCPEG